MIYRLICVLIGYVFGLFQTSYIIGRIRGIDIRDYGSGNAGTTNAFRTLGSGLGMVTFFGDALKCVFAALFVWLVLGRFHREIWPLLCIYTGAGVILGHNYPFYLGFRGGKGIAATGGMIFSLNIPLCFVAILTFGAAVFLTGYVSVGSLCVCSGFLIELVITGQFGLFHMAQRYLIEMYIVAFLLTALAFYKHRANISRILNGEEPQASVYKKLHPDKFKDDKRDDPA